MAGLSKLARTVEVYSKKPQIQERLNIEVADALMDYLGAKGAFVVIEAEHMCMSMRGVRKPGTATLTTVGRVAYLRRIRTSRPGLSLFRDYNTLLKSNSNHVSFICNLKQCFEQPAASF